MCVFVIVCICEGEGREKKREGGERKRKVDFSQNCQGRVLRRSQFERKSDKSR